MLVVPPVDERQYGPEIKSLLFTTLFIRAFNYPEWRGNLDYRQTEYCHPMPRDCAGRSAIQNSI